MTGAGVRSPRGGRVASLVALVAAVVLAASPVSQAAQGSEGSADPDVSAATWLLLDPSDGQALAAHDPSKERPIASTTKLMTAYLALKNLSMKQKLEVPAYSPGPAESVAGLIKGERLTVHDLLTAMMLPSANDAAVTVADGVAGSQKAFVAEMNQAAARLGLDHTSYANPIGLDAKDNYSSAADLADLSLELLGDRRFRKIVAEPEATLTSGSQERVVENTNTLLLSDPSVDGVKTGHTLDAGYVLVASAKRDGIPLIAAVLGAPSEADRDASAESLLDYGYSLYDTKRVVKKGEELAAAAVRYEDDDLPLLAEHTISLAVRKDQEVRVEVEGPMHVEGPIADGERLGEVTVTIDGELADRTPLIAGRTVEEPTLIDRIGGPLVAALIVLAVVVILAAVAFLVRRRRHGDEQGERDPEERMRTRQERIRRRDEGEGE